MAPLAPTLALAACCLAAQTPEVPPPAWIASFGYEHTYIDQSGLGPWHAYSASVGWRGARGAIGLSAAHVDRDVASDQAVGIDIYTPTWPTGYANLRAHVAPDAAIISRMSGAVELFQVLAPEWEMSVALRADEFADVRVGVVGGSLARIVGPWAFRVRVNGVTVEDEWSAFGGLHVRRTLGDRDAFVEFFSGGGNEVVEILFPGPPGTIHPDIRAAATANLGAQWLLTQSVGARLGIGYSAYQNVADRVHGRAGLVVRW